jgi:glutamine synthetase
VLQQIITEHGAVVFNGNGYSTEWHEEAARRGLPNLPTAADALPVLAQKDIEELFTRTGVLSSVELASRYEVYAEQYILSIEVEAKLVASIARTTIYPVAARYLSDLAGTLAQLKDLGAPFDRQILDGVAAETQAMLAAVAELEAALGSHDFDSTAAHMQYCAKSICPLMLKVRSHVDALEGLVANDLWPLPSYQEMLFIK